MALADYCKITTVGSIDAGGFGHDNYSELELTERGLELLADEGLDPERDAEAVLQVVREQASYSGCFSHGVGKSFCNSITVMANPHNERKFVAIAHIRYDV